MIFLKIFYVALGFFSSFCTSDSWIWSLYDVPGFLHISSKGFVVLFVLISPWLSDPNPLRIFSPWPLFRVICITGEAFHWTFHLTYSIFHFTFYFFLIFLQKLFWLNSVYLELFSFFFVLCVCVLSPSFQHIFISSLSSLDIDSCTVFSLNDTAE